MRDWSSIMIVKASVHPWLRYEECFRMTLQVTYSNACQSRYFDGIHLVYIIADSKLSDTVVSPPIDFASVGNRHARSLTTGNTNDLSASQSRIHQPWRALIRADAAAYLSAIILSPSIHLDKQSSTRHDRCDYR